MMYIWCIHVYIYIHMYVYIYICILYTHMHVYIYIVKTAVLKFISIYIVFQDALRDVSCSIDTQDVNMSEICLTVCAILRITQSLENGHFKRILGLQITYFGSWGQDLLISWRTVTSSFDGYVAWCDSVGDDICPYHEFNYMAVGQIPCTPGEHQNRWDKNRGSSTKKCHIYIYL